jgi:hypothetical protein
MRTRYTTPWPILPLPVTKRHGPVQFACVSVYRTVTQPSGGLVFGAGQGRLDTVWTRMGQGWPRIPAGRGGMGGVWRRRTCVRTSEICVKNHE